jgi:hypothetical protein
MLKREGGHLWRAAWNLQLGALSLESGYGSGGGGGCGLVLGELPSQEPEAA